MPRFQTYFFCLSLAVLVFSPLAIAVVDKWTPAGFNWSAVDPGPKESWNGLYQNLSDPSVAVSKEVMALGHVRTASDGSTALAIPFFLGLAWQAFNLVLTGAGLAGAIVSCQQSEGSPENIFFCVTGLLSTLVGIGGAASAAKTYAQSRGYLGVAANAWSNSGLESIALDVFSKRDLLTPELKIAQHAHNHFVHTAIRSLAVDGSVEFVGYAEDTHRLARRTSSEHPFAPMFRFNHTKHGAIEVTSRDLGEANGGMHFTVSYAGHPAHHAASTKRDEYFQHERLNTDLFEGRFDSGASNADPATISFDAAGAFDQIESSVECYTDGSWPDGNVLSVQMYDQANQATFGFASIGIFADNSVDSGLEGFEPSGMPLASPSC
ncbi:hypothetical protein DTO212C5_3228 [Paecilomyces variotii]|nr:hypothetical protein DTO212C5_3228 [Paecilomyces variotii]